MVTTNNPLLTDPRPWCIGRFVLDRPARSELGPEEYEYWGDKIDIARNVSLGTFQHKVDTRESELRTRKRNILIPYNESVRRGLPNGIVEIDVPWLERAVSPFATSRLLIFKKDGDADASFKGEGYVLADGTMLTMKFVLGSGAVQKVIQKESDWYRHITHRDDWVVPTERGFCIKGALIGGPSRNSELLTHGIALQPGRPALFLIEMRDAVDVDQQFSLLKTLPDLRRQLSAQGHGGRVRVLREGKRQVAGMDAEEVLFSIQDGSVQLFRFYLLAPGNPDTVAQPHTEIRLILGSTNDTTASPEQATSPVDEVGAIQVWDTLLNSMRLRPGAM